MRLFLRKNDLTKNPKLPYFELVIVPEEEGAKWKKIGAFWKSKSGSGYSGVLEEGVVLDTSKMKEWKPEKKDDGSDAGAGYF